jgi:hypothetical protein
MHCGIFINAKFTPKTSKEISTTLLRLIAALKKYQALTLLCALFYL